MPNTSIIVRNNLLNNILERQAYVGKLNDYVNSDKCSHEAFKLLEGTIERSINQSQNARALLNKFDAGKFTRKDLLLAANNSFNNIAV